MSPRPKALIAWSSGKDSAWALHEVRRSGAYDVIGAVCVDLKKLPKTFAGRKFDAALLAELPEGADPCGENGEFHSCVVAGPMFSQKIAVKVGDTVERDGFAFADLLPA